MLFFNSCFLCLIDHADWLTLDFCVVLFFTSSWPLCFVLLSFTYLLADLFHVLDIYLRVCFQNGLLCTACCEESGRWTLNSCAVAIVISLCLQRKTSPKPQYEQGDWYLPIYHPSCVGTIVVSPSSPAQSFVQAPVRTGWLISTYIHNPSCVGTIIIYPSVWTGVISTLYATPVCCHNRYSPFSPVQRFAQALYERGDDIYCYATPPPPLPTAFLLVNLLFFFIAWSTGFCTSSSTLMCMQPLGIYFCCC